MNDSLSETPLGERPVRVRELWIPVVMALLMAVNYEIFVFPNAFAPAGINGIATMIQYVFHFSIGYVSLIVNVPLFLLAWRFIDRDFAVKSLTYVLVFSFATIALNRVDLTDWVYFSGNGNSAILGPIVAGVIAGFAYSACLHNNGSTGGTDIFAAWIRTKRPEMSMIWIIFTLNAVVALVSFFVYNHRYEPVVMCLIYSYLSSFISDTMLKGIKKAYKFEIITEDAAGLSKEIMNELHHGVTLVHAEGMYSGTERELLICIVNHHQLVAFRRILARYPKTFSYVSEVTETVGNFKKIKR